MILKSTSTILRHKVAFIALINVASAAAHPRITPAPEYHPDLRPRDLTGPNVFGYISGDINQPLGCSAGYEYVKQSDWAGCCNEAKCDSVYFTCVNEGQENPCDGALGSYCSMFPQYGVGILSCEGERPFCQSYQVMSNSKDLKPGYLPQCGTASSVIEVFRTATNAVNAPKPSNTNKGPATSAAQPSSINRLPSQTAIFEPGSTSAPTTPTEQPNNNSGVSTKTIIIAASLGGAFLLAVILGGIWYLRRRQKKLEIRVHEPKPPAFMPGAPTDTATEYSRAKSQTWVNSTEMPVTATAQERMNEVARMVEERNRPPLPPRGRFGS